MITVPVLRTKESWLNIFKFYPPLGNSNNISEREFPVVNAYYVLFSLCDWASNSLKVFVTKLVTIIATPFMPACPPPC